MIPIAIVGFFFKDQVEAIFGSGLLIVGIMLFVTALLLAFSYFCKPKQKEQISEPSEERKTNSKEYWAKKLYEYMQDADDKQKEWTKVKDKNGTTKEERLQSLFKEKFGFDFPKK